MSSKETPNIFRLLRIARNKKVKDLANDLRVTPAYINAIESNDRIPSDRLLQNYAIALDVPEEIFHTFDISNNGEPQWFEKALLRLLQLIISD